MCTHTHTVIDKYLYISQQTHYVLTHIKCDNSIFILPVLKCVQSILLTTQMYSAPYSTFAEAFSAISGH